MNFHTILEELDRLYEAKNVDTDDEVDTAAFDEDEADVVNDEDEVIEIEDDEADGEVDSTDAQEEPVAEEDSAADEEPVQLVLKCANCGALTLKAEVDVEVDEKSDLANIKEECQYCDEADGYEVLGMLGVYANASEDALDEGIFGFGAKKNKAAANTRANDEEVPAVAQKPYESEYDRRERERKEREAERRLAQYRQAGQEWRDSLKDKGSSPSNTPYAGIHYSGGDYYSESVD
jgi:hypothetical protein